MHSIQLINTCRALSVKNITSFIQRQEAWCLKTSKPLLSPQETYGINKKPWELYKQLFCKGKYVLRYSTGCSSHAPGASSAIWTAQPLLHQLANIQCWPADKSLSSAPGCFTVYHHFSPVSPLPKSTVSSPPTNLTAFTWDLLFVAIPSKACWEVSVSYCGGIFWKTNSSSVFSAYSGLITSGDMFSVNGMKKNQFIYYTEACVWYLLLKIYAWKNPKPQISKTCESLYWKNTIKVTKKVWENTRTDVVHATLLQSTERCFLHCSLHSHDEILHSLVQED